LRLWGEPVIEGSIHSPHPVARPLGRAKPRDAKMLPAFSGSGTIFKEPASGGFLLF
jgi:hypothetical protein